MTQTAAQETNTDLQEDFARGLLDILRQNVAQAERLMAHAVPEPTKARALDRNDAVSRSEIAAALPQAQTEATEEDYARHHDDPEFVAALQEFAERQELEYENAGQIIEDFDWMLVGLIVMQEEYVKYCARQGLDPATALPSIARLAAGLEGVAASVGVEAETANAETPKAAIEAAVDARDPTKLSEFAERYLDLRCRGLLLQRRNETPDEKTGESFRANSRRNIEGTVGIFIDLFGDIPAADIHDGQCAEFVRILCRIPSKHGKSAKETRGLRDVIADADRDETRAIETLRVRMRKEARSPGEIEEAERDARVERLRANTCVRHMRDFSRMMEFAVFDGVRSSNPMKENIWTAREIKNRTSRETGRLRTGWGDSAAELLASPIYRDPLDEPGEPLFWAPLLGLFAGLRMEEALQLRLDDFQTEGGIPFISVQLSDPTQKLKKEASRRRVPLHRGLIDLGLPQLVELRRSNNHGRLFTYLERGKTKGKFSELFSKRFTYYRKQNDLYRESFDFHSLRTEFQTLLTYAKVPEHTRKYLIGHANSDITHTNYYRVGDPISTLKEAVDLIEIDISGVRRPFGEPASVTPPLGLRVVS